MDVYKSDFPFPCDMRSKPVRSAEPNRPISSSGALDTESGVRTGQVAGGASRRETARNPPFRTILMISGLLALSSTM